MTSTTTENVSSSLGDSSVGTTIHLLPDDIKVVKEQNVRKFKSSPIAEEASLAQLAESLIRDGQLQPCVVKEYAPGKYSLYFGHRRRLAAAKINAGEFKSLYNPSKQGPFTLECIVRDYGEEGKRKAIMENLKRKNFSPMDLLLLIGDVRKDNGWEDGEHTKEVAAYLGISPASVTEHERLKELPKAAQEDVDSGELSLVGALTLLKKVEPAQREAVAAAAKGEAKKEAVAASNKAQTSTQLSKAQKAEIAKNAAKPKTQAKHITKAARDQKALKGKEPRSKKDLVEFFESMAGPASPSVMSAFAAYLVKFAAGEGTEGTLTQKWDAIANLIPEKAKGDASKGKKAA